MASIVWTAMWWVVTALIVVIFDGLALLTVIAFVGAPLLYLASAGAKVRKWWYMRRLDPVGPNSLEEGIQEVSGTAQPLDDPGSAPFTGEESLAWQ